MPERLFVNKTIIETTQENQTQPIELIKFVY